MHTSSVAEKGSERAGSEDRHCRLSPDRNRLHAAGVRLVKADVRDVIAASEASEESISGMTIAPKSEWGSQKDGISALELCCTCSE